MNFRQAFAKLKSGDIKKDQPTSASVHVATALGNQRRRSRNFQSALSDASKDPDQRRQSRTDKPKVAKHYNSADELPQAVKDKIKDPKKRRQFMHVFNSELTSHGDESRAFAGAYSAVSKAWADVELVAKHGDDDQRLVFGWASVIEENGVRVVDCQDDAISEATLEKAFYNWAEEYRRGGEMHLRDDAGQMVECMVFTKAKQKALGIDLKKVGAWIGLRVDADTFAKVKSGEYKGLSIGGTGRRVPL